MYVYVYVHVYVHLHVQCMCVYVCMCIHISFCVCVCARVLHELCLDQAIDPYPETEAEALRSVQLHPRL